MNPLIEVFLDILDTIPLWWVAVMTACGLTLIVVALLQSGDLPPPRARPEPQTTPPSQPLEPDRKSKAS